MNPRIKRLLSMLLALTMMFSLVVPVSAAGSAGKTVEIEVGESVKLGSSGWFTRTTWTSSDETVATVSSNGTVTGVAVGTATVTATSKSFFGFFGGTTKTTYTVVVTEGTIEVPTEPEETLPEVTEPEAGLTVKEGQTLQLTVDANGGKTTWSSSDETVATVDENGLVTGVSEGEVTITATVKKSTGLGFWFFWWGSKTTTTKTEFQVTVLPGDEEPTEPEVPTEPEAVTYTVTFESNGGSAVEAQVVEEGMTASEPEAPTMEGYTFAGWYTDAELTQAYDFATPVTADITLYAAWEEVVVYYTVTFESNGGSAVGAQVVEEGMTATEPEAPTMEGYAFTGWYTDAELTTAYDFATPVTADITLYADWKENAVDPVSVNLSASRMELSDDDDGTVYFYATITGMVSNVYLIDGATGEVVMELVDDGAFSESGDDLPNDNIFSCKLDLGLEEEKVYTFYAKVVVNETTELNSDSVEIKVIHGFTDEELANMQTVDAAVQENLFANEDYNEMTVAERAELALEILNELAEQGLVDPDTILYDEENECVSFMYEAGVLGTIVLKDWSEDTNGNARTRDEENAVVLNTDNDSESETNTASEEVTYLGDAIVLWSFNQSWDRPTYREPFYHTLETDFEAAGLDTTVDFDTTVEDYKNLSGYEVIVFSGHGEHTTYLYEESDGTIVSRVLSGLMLTEYVDEEKDEQYGNDLREFRVGKSLVPAGTVYAILPSFFTHYYDSNNSNRLDGSFVFGENCEFQGKNGNVVTTMADSLTAASAEAVIGFHNSVMADYSRDMMRDYVLNLTEGMTAGDAFEDVKSIHGQDDYFPGREDYGPTAYPLFAGDEEATLIQNGIKNGDFEQASTPISWNQVGDTRVLTQLGSLTPVSNSRMAILTTGIGSAEEDYLAGTEGSVLSQTFRVPENTSFLSFSYDVISEEPSEYVGSSFDDTFLVKLKVGSDVYTIASESVNNSTWYQIEGINFEGGDSTTYHTMWQSMSVDMSSFVGQIVTLEFVVYDVGDSIFDTAALIDYIVLS